MTTQEQVADLATRLASPFDGYYTAEGVNGPFLSGEQVTTRLNAVLGVGLWQYRVIQFGVDLEADECWALGELMAYIDGQWITRQQFGGTKIKRGRQTGKPNNLADEYKGAATDAMKKCASLFGVGLYMMLSGAQWHAGVPQALSARSNAQRAAPQAAQTRQAQSAPASQPNAARPATTAPRAALSVPERAGPYPPERFDADGEKVLACQNCGEPLQSITRGNVKWTIAKLRYETRRYHGQQMCGTCLMKAEALKREQQAG